MKLTVEEALAKTKAWIASPEGRASLDRISNPRYRQQCNFCKEETEHTLMSHGNCLWVMECTICRERT